jgi:hypothetical protein
MNRLPPRPPTKLKHKILFFETHPSGWVFQLCAADVLVCPFLSFISFLGSRLRSNRRSCTSLRGRFARGGSTKQSVPTSSTRSRSCARSVNLADDGGRQSAVGRDRLLRPLCSSFDYAQDDRTGARNDASVYSRQIGARNDALAPAGRTPARQAPLPQTNRMRESHSKSQ